VLVVNGESDTMIDRHYGHLARDGHEHAIRLLDAHAAEQRTAVVDTRGRSVDAGGSDPTIVTSEEVAG